MLKNKENIIPEANTQVTEKLSKIAEVLGLLEETNRGKDWILKEIKKNKLKANIKQTTNSFEILKNCPMGFIQHLLRILKNDELDFEGNIKALTRTYHWFFTDIVGSANPTVLTKDQAHKVWALNQLVGRTFTFTQKNPESDVMTITGDGMVIGFADSPEKPLRLAMELQKIMSKYNQGKKGKDKLRIRVGIDTGPVYFIKDVTGKDNFWGPGIIMARRVMDLARPMQILASSRIADDISKLSPEYKSAMHYVGEYKIKHGEKLAIFNIYGEGWGNKLVPLGKIDEKEIEEGPNPLDPTTVNKYHKDVFVVVHYYTVGTITQPNPDYNALATVVNAYQAQNVYLHIQLPGSPISDTGLGSYNLCPALTCPPTPDNQYALTFPLDYDNIRHDNFYGAVLPGTNTPTGDFGTNGKVAKSQVFHYALWAFSMTGNDKTTSGYGDVIGNDLIVSLGNWPGVAGTTGTTGSPPGPDLQEGTFMHELGHNLGLNHGGPSDSTNCKTNYFSVMNYLWQFSSTYPPTGLPGPPPLRSLDYAEPNSYINLNSEAQLADANGIGTQGPATAYTVSGTPNPATPNGGLLYQTVLLPSNVVTPIDFDWNTVMDTSNQDINNFGITGCNGADLNPTESLNAIPGGDWGSLIYNFRSSSNFNTDPVHTNPTDLGEMKVTTFYQMVDSNIDYLVNLIKGSIHGYACTAACPANTAINTAQTDAKTSIDNGDFIHAQEVLQNQLKNNLHNWMSSVDEKNAANAVDTELAALSKVAPQKLCPEGAILQNNTCTTPNNQPSPPTLSVNFAAKTSISLSWTQVPGATYTLFRSSSGSAGPFTPITSGLTSTSFIDSGLSPFTTYYYQATATTNGGTSEPSNTVSATISKISDQWPPFQVIITFIAIIAAVTVFGIWRIYHP